MEAESVTGTGRNDMERQSERASERASHAVYGKTKEANNFGQFGGSRARPAKQRERWREREGGKERGTSSRDRTNERPAASFYTTRCDASRARCNAAVAATTVRLSIGEHPGGSHPDSPSVRLFALFAARSVTDVPSRPRARLRSRPIITITNTPLDQGCLRLTTSF